MAKVENEDAIESVEITSHTIYRDGTHAKIVLQGSCPKSSAALKIDVDATLYDAVPGSLTTYAEDTGIPVGECVNGVLTIDYPVPNPENQPRIIKFKVKSKMKDGKVSLYAALRDVEYVKPGETLAGYEVNSGGGFGATGGILIYASAGGVASKSGSYLVSGLGANLRLGLQGLLHNDTF